MRFSPRLSPLLVSLALLLGSCRSAGSGPQEESVFPGANDNFLSEDLDVQRFVGIFEGEEHWEQVSQRSLRTLFCLTNEKANCGPDQDLATGSIG